jgi:hypothetical protein
MKAVKRELLHSDVTGNALIVETERPWRMVCWEKAQYAPCWDVGDAWVTAEWLETMGTKSKGYNFEPMHDKECRYSRVHLVSKGNARCIVSWDYAVNNVRYELFHGNTTAEETFHIYPPGYAVRELVAHPGDQHKQDGVPTFWEVCEMIFINPKGMTPFDYIEEHAASYMNLSGDRYEQMWTREGWQPTWRLPSTTLCGEHPGSKMWDEIIIRAHLKDRPDPFIAFPTSQSLFPHSICSWCNESNIPVRLWPSYCIWPHWPVYEGTDFRVARPGYLEDCERQPTHTSIFSAGAWYMHPAGRIEPEEVRAPWWYPRPNDRWLFLTGVTDQDDKYLLDLVKSWLHPAKVAVIEGGRFLAYDLAQMAYRFQVRGRSLKVVLESQGGMLNPVFALLGWEVERVDVFVNEKRLDETEYRLCREDASMIVFLEKELPPQVEITFSS